MRPRPRSLADAVERHRAGGDFGVVLNEFLDEFYLADNAKRQSMIEQEPMLLDDRKLNAYIGAIGEHLADRWHLDHPPRWVGQPERFLDWPWFPDGKSEKLRMILLMESPIAFRRRDIYTEAEPLRRARMPRDSRAIANEAGLW